MNIFPDLVCESILYYRWRNYYRTFVISGIKNDNILKTLFVTISLPYIENRNFIYRWDMLYHLNYNIFQPFGTWLKYQDTLNKQSEKIVTFYHDDAFTHFPIDRSTAKGIHSEYYCYS